MSSDWLNPEDEMRALGYLEAQFGIPAAALAGHRLLRRGQYLYAVRREAAEVSETLHWVSTGLRILKTSGSGFKPATPGIQVFGRWATSRVWDVSSAELEALLQGRSIPSAAPAGLTLLTHRGFPVGLGVARGGFLLGQIPRSVTENLRYSREPEPEDPERRSAGPGDQVPGTGGR